MNHACRNITITAHLGFEGANATDLVGTAHSNTINHLGTTVNSLASQCKIVADLVSATEVECRALVRSGHTGIEWAGRITGAQGEAAQTGTTAQGVSCISANLNTRSHSNTSRRTELGHFHDVQSACSIQATFSLVNANVGSFV